MGVAGYQIVQGFPPGHTQRNQLDHATQQFGVLTRPAGVVLLAEGWALSPARMKALHSQIRSIAGSDTMIHFLVANAADGKPGEVKDEEKGIWMDFVDGLADSAAETFFYEEEER